jgi:aminoglycoside 6'-N-acetyltransferase
MKIQDPDGLIADIAWKSKTEIDEIQLQYPEDRALILDLLNE